MGKLWGFGTAAVDFRITTADYGEGYKDKLLAQDIGCFGGGAAANCLVQSARLGCAVGWLGKLGHDTIAQRIIALLGSEGVDCRHVVYSDTETSPFNVAIYAGEQKRRVGGFLLPNALSSLTDDELQGFAAAMTAGDWLAIEIGEIPLISCLRLAQLARECGVKVALDVDLDPIRQCGGDRETVAALLAAADLLIPNVCALRSLYDETDPAVLCRLLYAQYGVPTVITAGGDGAYYVDRGGQLAHQAALPTDVKDTVGAGDAFHGGLLCGLSEGRPLDEAVLLGTVCGALNCAAFGAREGMPDRAGVQAFLKEITGDS